MDNNASYEAVFERLLQVTGTKSDSALARLLEIKPQSVVAARKRRQIPPGWLVSIAKSYGVSADWLFFGKGDARPEEQNNCGKNPGQENKKTHCSQEMENLLSEREKRILELERQLAEAKEDTLKAYRLVVDAQHETLKAYRLAVGALQPAVEEVQAPPPPHYGPKPQSDVADSQKRDK